MKKHFLFSLLLLPILAGCTGQSLVRVAIPFSDEMKTTNGALINLASYNDLEVKVDNEESFLLVVGNNTCLCTLDFTPVLSEWIEATNIPVYYLEFTLLLFQDEKFDIPLSNNSTPILNIFEDGKLAHYRAYSASNASRNAVFYDIDLLTVWLNDRLVLPTFRFLTKANFDALFLKEETFIIYIGREDCADCSYAFQTFVIPFLKDNAGYDQVSALPVIYGLDVMQNGIRLPVMPGSELTTGNNTPGWETFKSEYGLNTTLNTTFGYSTGFVPTFMVIEGNGKMIKEDPSIIADMIVVYNDSSVTNPSLPFHADTNPRGTSLTRTFFDGTRPLAYTNLDLTSLVLPAHSSTSALRDILKSHHNGALQAFFDYYLPLLD
jgi:hypothetical protein